MVRLEAELKQITGESAAILPLHLPIAPLAAAYRRPIAPVSLKHRGE
jgi:hypothetical protein